MPATLTTTSDPLPRAPRAEIAPSPAKVYVEPTNRCNLRCRTCARNVWEERPGDMSRATFARVVASIRACPLPLTIFFGGYGEPLFHPAIIQMVADAKATSATVELITNGTLLTPKRARDLIAAGLDALWVSLDGATPESYADVRLGATLPRVIANLARFRDLRGLSGPEIGIAFVAMRRNIADLPALLRLARDLGATRFMVTNVLPHTLALDRETLFARAISNGDDSPIVDATGLSLPRMDRRWLADSALQAALRLDWGAQGTATDSRALLDRCPFIEHNALAIGWDGSVSPCLPLLHTTASTLRGCARLSRRYSVGSVHDASLIDLWRAPEHVAFRDLVREFDFSPCALCDGCLLSETNERDCYGNAFPTCGGCLWAQGVIQCP